MQVMIISLHLTNYLQVLMALDKESQHTDLTSAAMLEQWKKDLITIAAGKSILLHVLLSF